jgi:Zn-dependent peptidase ImmA (M78 family)/DNA-binding XRE family transcriptional regulator
MELERIGELLKTARERAGLSQEAASEAVNINRVALSYYESGRRQPPLGAAVALARLYGTSVEDLMYNTAATRDRLDVSGVLFRAAPRDLGERAQAGLRLLEQHLADYVELADELSATLPGAGRSPLSPARTASARDAAAAARSLRRHLDLGGGALGDPFQALDPHVLVWRLPFGSDLEEAPSGLFYNHPRAGFCVAVNSDMTLGRQVFTLAHELGHAYFHSQSVDVVVSMHRGDHDRERFADSFAGELLVPGDELRGITGELAPFDDLSDPAVVVHLQRHFGVSFATLRVRLLTSGLISRQIFDNLAEVSPSRLAGSLGYSVHPADMGSYELKPFERFPARMLLLVRNGVERGAITRGDAAETLGTSSEEIRRLLVRPSAESGDRRNQKDLEAAALANRES